MNNDIQLFDNETLNINNLIYSKKHKKFLFNSKYSDINKFLNNYDDNYNINNIKCNKIINEPLLIINTLHSCFSHALIDCIFPLY